MKTKLLLFIFITSFFVNCDDDNTQEDVALLGKWKLIQILFDPGDGSGTFQNVNSNRIINFHSDGTITSNGNLCTMSIDTNEDTSGTYSEQEMKFTAISCIEKITYAYTFEISGNTLIINYPCIEACQAKFVKI